MRIVGDFMEVTAALFDDKDNRMSVDKIVSGNYEEIILISKGGLVTQMVMDILGQKAVFQLGKLETGIGDIIHLYPQKEGWLCLTQINEPIHINQ